MTDKKDDLGDRMKAYEDSVNRVVFKGTPIVIRLDGHGFSKYTKGFERPYDARMSGVMIDTTKALVNEFQCNIGYTQSDEITLVWYLPAGPEVENYPYNGRIQKLLSLTAGYASSKFKMLADVWLEEKADKVPCFDAREVAVPTLGEAFNCLRWRQSDARKNAVSMAAQATFKNSKQAAKALHGVSQHEMLELLKNEGIDFEGYPTYFKRGSFIFRRKFSTLLTAEERAKIPEKHRPPIDEEVIRSSIVHEDFPLFAKMPDKWHEEIIIEPAAFVAVDNEMYKRNSA